jgi:hypothetical protein
VAATNGGDGVGVAELFSLIGSEDDAGYAAPRIDIDLVGARVGVSSEGKPTVELAVHTAGIRTIPQEAQIQVFLDTDLDGDMEWLVHNVDPGQILVPPRTTGRQWALVRDVTSNAPVTVGGRLTAVNAADLDLYSRTAIFRIPASTLGYKDGAAIAFDAVVRAVPSYPDVRGDERSFHDFDAIPDDGWDEDSIDDGRLSFSAAALPFALDAWRLTVPAVSSGSVGLSVAPGTSGRLDDQLVAFFITNIPGDSDTQVLAIEVADVPPTPTLTPTAKPRTPRPTTATATARPSATPGGPVLPMHIFLPATMDRSDL